MFSLCFTSKYWLKISWKLSLFTITYSLIKHSILRTFYVIMLINLIICGMAISQFWISKKPLWGMKPNCRATYCIYGIQFVTSPIRKPFYISLIDRQGIRFRSILSIEYHANVSAERIIGLLWLEFDEFIYKKAFLLLRI